MQLVLHPSSQEQSTGYSEIYTEPDFKIRSVVIKITAISVNLLGTITFKLQHSIDGSDWVDVPGATTQGINATGLTTITIDPEFACFNSMRLAWTFTNANSTTFYGAVLGTK